jgi:hypothetical protein
MVAVMLLWDGHGHFFRGGISANPLSKLLNPEVFWR